MLQLVSCVVSSLFLVPPNVCSINESAFFLDVMASVVKRGINHFPSALKNCLFSRSMSMFNALFSSFGPECIDPFEYPFSDSSDFAFLCRSASVFSSSLMQVLESRFAGVDDLTKLVRFLNAFGSVNWEETLPRFNFFVYAPGIHFISQQTQRRFVSLLFAGQSDSSALDEVMMHKLISSLSHTESSFMAHILKHSALSCKFFIPFSQYLSANIVSGHVSGMSNHLVFSFLQQCIPPGAFLQQRLALLQLSVCMPVQSRIHSASKKFQVSKIQRWIIDLLLPHLGASCTTTIDGQIQSILPHCGWCEIVLPGHSAFRLAVPEGLVFDIIYSANVPLSMADIKGKFPLQDFFVVDAIKSLLLKQLIAKTGSSTENFVVSPHFCQSPTNAIAEYPSFNCFGDQYCEVVHAILSLFKSSQFVYEHDLFRELCREKIDGKSAFSVSFVAFALSKILATGHIVRQGPLLLKAGQSLTSRRASFEPRELRLVGTSACIRSMVVVTCDDTSSIPSLSLSAAGTCESFTYDNALSLIVESFSRIHQDTGIDLREISQCFASCKGSLADTIHTLVFDPKYAAKLNDVDGSSCSVNASVIRYVEEGLCPTCLCDDILVALPCDHRYCQECLRLYIQDSMVNSSTPKAAGGADRAGGRVVTNICCPSHVEGCTYMIQTADVKFLATSEYASFVDLICRQSARAMASGAFPTVTCICGRLVVGQTSDSEFECSCGRISSIGDIKNSNGVQDWVAHPFSSCLQEERWKEYTQAGSEARHSLMRTKKCPSCGAKTTKCGCQGTVVCNQMDKCPNEACDHMTCGVCSSHWCWVCGRLGSKEARCSYPQHLITQTKELFKAAEAKVQEMEKDFFKNSWRVIRFDPCFNTATVLSVAQTPLPFSSLANGDIIISVNGQRVVSADSAQQAISTGWVAGHYLRIEYQRKGKSALLVLQAPTDSIPEQDAFVLRRSRIVSSVSDISAAAHNSDLENSRALLDKIISEIFKEPPQTPIAVGGFFSGAAQAHQPAQLSATIQPPSVGCCDIITNAALDPRIQFFLQAKGSTGGDQTTSIVADLVDVQKSVLKSLRNTEGASHAPHFYSASSANNAIEKSVIVKRVCPSVNVRVRYERSVASAHMGTLRAGAVFLFSKVEGDWAKLHHLHAVDLQKSTSCVVSDFKPPLLCEKHGYCVTHENGAQHFEDPSESEKASALARFGLKLAATDSAMNPNPTACYVWKSWAFSVTSSSKGHLNYITFWSHNGTLKPKQAPPPAVLFGLAPEAAPSLPAENDAVTRVVERCDKFAGCMAILDKDREAWLFSCPHLMTPIDSSSATLGRSVQNRPWLLNLNPTFCSSMSEFSANLLSRSSDQLKTAASTNVSVLQSVELDAIAHRYYGDDCLVIHGNGDWATCHLSQLPASFQEVSSHSKPVDLSPSNFFSTSILHVGSWDGCGGNIAGVSGCAGNGNCSASCRDCGARSHWTCCGSNDKESKTCHGPMSSLQASENDRVFRFVVREQPIKCVDIKELSGGQFSIGKITSMPSITARALASDAAVGSSAASNPTLGE
jgi:hypothetical protein